MRWTTLTGAATALLCTAALSLSGVTFAGPAAASPAKTAPSRLTNLGHLNSLLATVNPPAQTGHTTYQLAQHPGIGVLWVYANHQSDGSYANVGGGDYNATDNTYGQGSYDADDISRAAVVYLRQWQQQHDPASREHAMNLLRGLTYLQTATGPNAGNVVLWMQPDGTLNPTPTPPDSPNPSDTGASFWLARTMWALGEGYADFRHSDPAFAQFLGARMQLAIGALDRQVLVHYGSNKTVHGKTVPAWLIGDGADASSEAVLGLSSYVHAGGGSAARTALAQLATGISLLGKGNPQTWPYGAVMPSALMPSDWHAWASQMPAALANAAQALHQPNLLRNAISDAAVFVPHLLTATGPSNGWLPTPVDNSQIAYGIDSQVESLLAVSDASGSSGIRQLAGIAAAWFFGANNADVPTYDPSSGVAYDGVSPTGVLNTNSGAESTIHALLTMQALDARPDVRALAQQSAAIVSRGGEQTIEAEAAQLGGGATVVTPASAWTGEAQYSGGKYVSVTSGSTLSWTVPASSQDRLVRVVVDRVAGNAGVAHLSTGAKSLGDVTLGGEGSQGAAPAPDELVPVTLSAVLPAGATTLSAAVSGGSATAGRLDAIQLTPLVSTVIYRGADAASALLSNQATTTQRIVLTLAGNGSEQAQSFDSRGRLVSNVSAAGSIRIVVPPGGFAVARR
ncbi:MAG TPA: hypothetical protein VGH11_09780 [Jatrophihabitans sp.]|jgi:hypothetical protein